MRLRVLLLIAVISFSDTVGAVIRVEKDGSGDFQTIQDAVNVASVGDTVLIGEGRFDERMIVTTPGWSSPVYILVQTNDLTLIGAGQGRTIVGQAEPWDYSQPMSRGIEAGEYWDSPRIHVEGIRFENIAFAVGGNPGPDLYVSTCDFAGNYYSVISVGPVLVDVGNCSFTSMIGSGIYVYGSHNDLHVADCIFDLDTDEIESQLSIVGQLCVNTLVENSQFVSGTTGVKINGGPGQIVGCDFTRQERFGIIVVNSAMVEVFDCALDNQYYAIGIDGASAEIVARNVSIANVTEASIGIGATGRMQINECVLARGAHYSVFQYYGCPSQDPDPLHLDMRNNDWGTASADSIEARIHVCDYVVDYIPFVGQDVQTEKTSWSAVKALFEGKRSKDLGRMEGGDE